MPNSVQLHFKQSTTPLPHSLCCFMAQLELGCALCLSLCPLFSVTLIGAFGIGHCDVRKPPIGPIAPMHTRACVSAFWHIHLLDEEKEMWCIGWPHRPANSAAAALLGRNYDANRSPLPPIWGALRLHCRIVCVGLVEFISLPYKCFLLECIMQCVFFCCSVDTA